MSEVKQSTIELQNEIKSALAALNMSQRKLSIQINVSSTALSQWMNNKYPGRGELIEDKLRIWVTHAIMKETTEESALDFRICGGLLRLYSKEGRHWISLSNICENLELNIGRQIARVNKHHKKHGLQLLIQKKGEETCYLIPLAEVSWFLRTLRPRSDSHKNRITNYRHQLNDVFRAAYSIDSVLLCNARAVQ